VCGQVWVLKVGKSPLFLGKSASKSLYTPYFFLSKM